MLRDSQIYLQTDNPVELTKLYEEIYDVYDPDSSPFAWEYYHTIYKNIIEFNNTNDGYYESYPSKKAGITYTRNIAVFKWYNKYKSKETQCEEETNLKQTKKACLKKDKHLEFGGDCSFNFNDDKYTKFMNIISKNSELQDKLNFCAMMHRSPLNFAIMPRTGGLNNAKGDLGYIEDPKETEETKETTETRYIPYLGKDKIGVGHDRLDSFIVFLNDFYIMIDDEKIDKDYIKSLKKLVIVF